MDAGSVLCQKTLRQSTLRQSTLRQSTLRQSTLRIRSRPTCVQLGMGGLSLLAALPLMVALTSCFGPSSTPLRIGANLWMGHETLFLARDLGELNGKPIRLVDDPSGTEEVRACRNNEIDGAGLSIDRVITLATTLGDIRIIAVMDHSNGGDVIVARPGPTTMRDLKGKRIGVEATALGPSFPAGPWSSMA
jgi:NitT/TauT family transport system substrate-binding protein